MDKLQYIEILGRKIGQDFPPLVIAEIGINHGGSIQTAFEMVDAGKKSWSRGCKTSNTYC